MVFCSCLRRACHDRGGCPRFTIPTHSRINAREFSREARSLLDQFDRTETGDFVVLTSKGQQETVFALERASGGLTAPGLRLEHALHKFLGVRGDAAVRVCECWSQIDLSLQHAEIGFGILAAIVRQTTWNYDGCVDRCEDGKLRGFLRL